MEIQARGLVRKCEIRETGVGDGFMTEGHRFELIIQGLKPEEGDQLAIPGAMGIYSTYPMAPGTAVIVELKSINARKEDHDGEAGE